MIEDTDKIAQAEEADDVAAALAAINEGPGPGIVENPISAPTSATGDTGELVLSPAQEQMAAVLDEHDLDRQKLGTLLRRGQRLALHVQAKVALPEFTGWAQEVQAFINEFGL